jgi:hypothetical protein
MSRIAGQMLALFVIALFLSTEAIAQGGSGDLPVGPSTKPKPTPAPKNPAPVKVTPKPVPTPAPTPSVLPIAFNQLVTDRLDAKTSKKNSDGTIYQEYILKARADEWLNFQIQSDAADLVVLMVDENKSEVPIARGGANIFKINTQTGGVPADGEYRVRVAGKTPSQYSLLVNRLGLTVNVFNERFNKIYSSIRENDPTSIDAAIVQFEALAQEDGYRPTTYEQLGLMYLYNRKDFVKAEHAMSQAIKLNGAAVVKITFDSQWRRMAKLRTGRFDFEDARTGWLRIRPGQLVLTDPSSKPLATVNGTQIKELSNITAQNYHLVTITGEVARRPFVFAPGSKEKGEADLVVRLIQTHVLGKGN